MTENENVHFRDSRLKICKGFIILFISSNCGLFMEGRIVFFALTITCQF